jgi:protein TonB
MKTRISLVLLATALVSSVPMKADGKIEPPIPVRTVAPDYPNDMRRDGVTGMVMISCLIDEQGNVADSKVEKASNQAFAPCALAALKKWKFKPAQRDGAIVPIHVTIPIKFTLDS